MPLTPHDRVQIAATLRQLEQANDIRVVFARASAGVTAHGSPYQVRVAYVRPPEHYHQVVAPQRQVHAPLPGMPAEMTALDLRETMNVAFAAFGTPAAAAQLSPPLASTYIDARVSDAIVSHRGMETLAIAAARESPFAREMLTSVFGQWAADCAQRLGVAPQAVGHRPEQGGDYAPRRPVAAGGNAWAGVVPQDRLAGPLAAPGGVFGIDFRIEPPLSDLHRSLLSQGAAAIAAAAHLLRFQSLPDPENLELPEDLRTDLIQTIDGVVHGENGISREEIAHFFANANQRLMANMRGAMPNPMQMFRGVGPVAGPNRAQEEQSLMNLMNQIVPRAVLHAPGIRGSALLDQQYADHYVDHLGQAAIIPGRAPLLPAVALEALAAPQDAQAVEPMRP